MATVPDLPVLDIVMGGVDHPETKQSFGAQDYVPQKKGIAKLGNNIRTAVVKYARFVGPGLMVSVAYMDPGNYATATSAGASNRYALLFVVFISNAVAVFLQSLCIKLGTVTGKDLARSCREICPRWLNLVLYLFAECAIVATDVAEVIGSAIALNILFRVPLPAGVAISVVDVFLVLMAYRPGSSLRFVRYFEYGVAVLVLAVVICFCVELGYLPQETSAKQIFRGFAPSKEMFHNNGIYTAASILGATVMPHSLFLGSGLVQPRLREYDVATDHIQLSEDSAENEEMYYSYKPSSAAIDYCLKYSIIELATALFTFALFVNCAILIVSGATLYGTTEAVDADLYDIHSLLSTTIAPVVGTVFMVALLCSGQSAGIVCTIAGQIVCEGHIQWRVKPWMRRLITRSIAIVPCLAISASLGRHGMGIALNASQFALSITLPFLTAPLIIFTCNRRIMRVEREDGTYKDMSNNWLTTVIAVVVWIFVAVLNVYALVQANKS
ncbi:unnamed protein product [Kuraishia capsulata CBS 1993]|uniref:Uncharacterized protein n=1 Tax=Kuraishia capsulata CBS 1993 TaxID=1382522 RepID=W6MUV6_9ASCO|nr:uncharacterized protein KUCA_T00005564001 [Kuraishia capsulata CBS 1993]CDK29572.1 unnamed protein product [Kuraishia capsulata CBS 1993]